MRLQAITNSRWLLPSNLTQDDILTSKCRMKVLRFENLSSRLGFGQKTYCTMSGNKIDFCSGKNETLPSLASKVKKILVVEDVVNKY